MADELVSALGCVRYPQFSSLFGFDVRTAVLSTSEPKRRGLVLIDTLGRRPLFQHPSWQNAGSLGGMTFSSVGDVITFPAPHVELTYNPLERAHRLYRVDSKTGQMSEWTELPSQKPVGANPYAILGVAFSCFQHSVYVSSVLGSSRNKIAGKIYQINFETGKILSVLSDVDAFGLSAVRVGGREFLLFGSARESTLYAVELNESGGFLGRPREIFSISNLGPRGDDKIKKIVVDGRTGMLLLSGFEFNFNLISTLERQESVFQVPQASIAKKLIE